MELVRVTRLDSIRLDESFFTSEGFFIDTPKVTRVGIFEYKNPDGSIRKELRLPEHVFDPESLATYEGKPVIITHAAGRVDKNNVDDEIVGTILSKGYEDGDSVRAKVVIHSIDSVKHSGLRELSLGYDLILDETPGTWNGKPYDAVQTKITVNHLALVHDARAGEQARLNLDEGIFVPCGTNIQCHTDQKPKGEMQMENSKNDLEKTTDDTSIIKSNTDSNTSPEDKIKAIKEKYDARRKDTTPPPDADKYPEIVKQQDSDIGELLELVEAIQAKYDFDSTVKEDSEEETKDGVNTMKADSMSASDIDAIVSERLALARLGDRLNLDGLETMKPLDAKKAVVNAVNPNMRLDGKGDMYVQVAFDQAVETLNSRKDIDFQRRQMTNRMDGMPPQDIGKPGALVAREKMTQNMMNGGSE